MGAVMDWLHRNEDREWGLDPEDFDPQLVESTLHRLARVFNEEKAYFRTEVHGIDRVPDEPALIVSNHSGGTSIPDAWGLAATWYRHFGTDVPLHALAHELVFLLKATGDPFARCGILRASPKMGMKVLTEYQRHLLVMPGGDRDTWRPYRDRYKVNFSGRTGYARLAIKAQVPIVPVANAGAHETLIVLTDGHKIAEKLKFQQLFRASIFPVHVSLPFGVTVGPTPHIPTPVTLRYRYGMPLQPPEHPVGVEPPREMVRAFDAQVRAAMQAELDILEQTAVPLAERFKRLGRKAVRRIEQGVERAVAQPAF